MMVKIVLIAFCIITQNIDFSELTCWGFLSFFSRPEPKDGKMLRFIYHCALAFGTSSGFGFNSIRHRIEWEHSLHRTFTIKLSFKILQCNIALGILSHIFNRNGEGHWCSFQLILSMSIYFYFYFHFLEAKEWHAASKNSSYLNRQFEDNSISKL